MQREEKSRKNTLKTLRAGVLGARTFLNSLSAEKNKSSDSQRHQPNSQHGLSRGEPGADQPMRKVISVPQIKWPAGPPAQPHDPRHVQQRERQREQRDQHGPGAGMMWIVEMRQNGHHSQEIPNQVAAGIAQEGASSGKIVRQETQQRTTAQEGEDCHQVLPIPGCQQRKVTGTNSA